MTKIFFDPAAWLAEPSVSLLSPTGQGICWRLCCLAVSKRKPWRVPKGRQAVASFLGVKKGDLSAEAVAVELLESGFWIEDEAGIWNSDVLADVFPEPDVSVVPARRSKTGKTKKNSSRETAEETPNDGFLLSSILEESLASVFSPPKQGEPVAPPQPSIWALGALILSRDGTDPAKARAFLGKLIHEHGEGRVAEALASMSLKPVPPAETKSYLLGILRKDSVARERRSRVVL